ncbi:MAG: bacteriohopanetetrol glucosamine biosynthesis glycosyltransferase HpnI [Candidatus Acidiferrales bacterium]
MGSWLLHNGVLILAIGPLAYYVLTLLTALRYFSARKRAVRHECGYAPPASILKPVRGLDRNAYDNFASFCRLDYPLYEIVFCVSDADDPAIPVIEKIMHDFPERQIRLLVGAREIGSSSKVNKLCRLVREAKYDLLVISDSDVRVGPAYLAGVAAPFADPRVGAVTAFFRSDMAGSVGATLDAAGSAVEFATAAILARWLEGIRFTLGATMATTKSRLSEIGGFEMLKDHYVDDHELGSRIAAHGYSIRLAQDPVLLVYPRETVRQFVQHELRWTIGLRNVRPGGHAAMAFTFGLPWTVLAALMAPSRTIAWLYVLAYLVLRYSVYGVVGVWGLDDPVARRWLILAPLRDAINFGVWVASFFSDKICWRGLEFQVKHGLLIPLTNGRGSK